MIPSVATCFSLNPYALRKWSSSASVDRTNGLDATTGGASLRAALSASCAAHPPAGIGPCSFALQCKTPTAPLRERWALAECSDAPTYSRRHARPLVDQGGLEPPTSSLQTRRSAGLSY